MRDMIKESIYRIQSYDRNEDCIVYNVDKDGD